MTTVALVSFVKLDCAMLNSSIWTEKAQRDIFITALLLAEPFEVREPLPQLLVNEIKETGWEVPPGWYGMVAAASVGIIHWAMVEREEGLAALEKLGQPDASSKSMEFDGRRMVRVNGGFIILNFITYRERDCNGAERSRRWRARQKEEESRAKARANGSTIRPEHRDDGGKPKQWGGKVRYDPKGLTPQIYDRNHGDERND